jgi:subtilisin family serine protease
LGAEQVWQEGIDGDGVVIGIVDGGILTEARMDPDLPGLVPRVMDGWPKANWGTIAGWRGHGNMLAIDALGMAPRASLYDIRIVDPSQNCARISDAIAGIHWAIEKYRATGTPQILCCGWGIYQHAHDPTYATDANHPLTRKIVEAMDEGILMLFAAGNGGQSCPATGCGGDVGPGKSIWGANGHPRVMTVGAVNIDEQLVGYSSQGPAAMDEYKPDFCGISHFAGYFSSDSGTSAACAVAAGVVALLKQARSTLTQEAVKRLLKSTAKDIGPPGWDRHSGSGIIQAKGAYDKLVGHRPLNRVDAARLEQLETENRYLRELFVELALERQMHRNGAPG